MAPQGTYAADSIFRLFGLWAAEEIYGWLWVTLVPLATVGGLLWTIWRAVRLERGMTDAITHFLYICVALYLLWPVPARLGSPLFSSVPEDDQALADARANLLDSKQRRFEGVPRIQLWLLAFADSVLGQATLRVSALNTRPLAHDDFLRLRVNHAMPLSVPLARRSAVYWALCYEPAIALYAAQNGAQQTPPGPLSPELDPYLPAHSDKEWQDLAGLLDERTGSELRAATGCRALRDALRQEYLDVEITRDPHHYLRRDLADAGVQVTDEAYAEHLVRQSLSPNAAYVTRLRSVWSDDSEVVHAPVVPHFREPDGMLQELANKVGEPVNAIYNWWTDRTAAVGTRVELPTAAKKSYETFRLLAPSFYGVAMCFVILVFPFLAVLIAFGYYKVLGTYLKIYLSIAAWPFLWTVIGSYQLFMASPRSWGSLSDYMGDAAGYGTIATPFLLAATPVLSMWLVHAACGAAQGAFAAAGAKAGAGGGGIERRMEGAAVGAGMGAASRGVQDAAKGAKLGGKAGASMGPVGAGVGAVLGGIGGAAIGVTRGAVEGGMRGALDPGHASSPLSSGGAKGAHSARHRPSQPPAQLPPSAEGGSSPSPASPAASTASSSAPPAHQRAPLAATPATAQPPSPPPAGTSAGAALIRDAEDARRQAREATPMPPSPAATAEPGTAPSSDPAPAAPAPPPGPQAQP